MHRPDPRSLHEVMENTLNPFRITKHSTEKCVCGHTVGFHHITGHCKASIFTPSCDCREVRVYVPTPWWKFVVVFVVLFGGLYIIHRLTLGV